MTGVRTDTKASTRRRSAKATNGAAKTAGEAQSGTAEAAGKTGENGTAPEAPPAPPHDLTIEQLASHLQGLVVATDPGVARAAVSGEVAGEVPVVRSTHRSMPPRTGSIIASVAIRSAM